MTEEDAENFKNEKSCHICNKKYLIGYNQQVMLELGIQQVKSSAYHPESQGALERFHQTLKIMIKIHCFDPGKDWDEGIHLLLFAFRETV